MATSSRVRLLAFVALATVFSTHGLSQENVGVNHTAPTIKVEKSLRTEIPFRPKHTAIIIVDMWRYQTEPYKSLAGHLAEEILPIVQSARRKGMTIIHAPGGVQALTDYVTTPYYQHRITTKPEPTSQAAKAVDTWPSNDYVVFYGCEYCKAGELEQSSRCKSPFHAGPLKDQNEPWLREDASLENELGKHREDWFIEDTDAGGKRLTTFLHRKAIDTIIFVGAATDQCVLTRPYGIRQMNANHFRCIAAKDLTQVSFCDRSDRETRMKEAQTKALAYLESVQGAYLVTSAELKKILKH